jgi:hypothetical protein
LFFAAIVFFSLAMVARSWASSSLSVPFSLMRW